MSEFIKGGLRALRILYCHCCGKIFCLCSSCYRGHRYCCDPCRIAAQNKANREAQKRYRRTEKGKKAHREAERRRRMRRTKKWIMGKVRTVQVECCSTAVEAARSVIRKGTELGKTAQCHFCQQYGEIVNKFIRKYTKKQRGQVMKTC